MPSSDILSKYGIKIPTSEESSPGSSILKKYGIALPETPDANKSQQAPIAERMAQEAAKGGPVATEQEFAGFDPSKVDRPTTPLFERTRALAESQSPGPIDARRVAQSYRAAGAVGIPGPANQGFATQEARDLLSGKTDARFMKAEAIPWHQFANVEGAQDLARLGLENPSAAHNMLLQAQMAARSGSALERANIYAPRPLQVGLESAVNAATLGAIGEPPVARTSAEQGAALTGAVVGSLPATVAAAATGGTGLANLAARTFPWLGRSTAAANLVRSGVQALGTGATLGAAQEAAQATRPDYRVSEAPGRIARTAATFGAYGLAGAGLGAAAERAAQVAPSVARAISSLSQRFPNAARLAGAGIEGTASGALVGLGQGALTALTDEEKRNGRSIVESALGEARQEFGENIVEALALAVAGRVLSPNRAAILRAADQYRQTMTDLQREQAAIQRPILTEQIARQVQGQDLSRMIGGLQQQRTTEDAAWNVFENSIDSLTSLGVSNDDLTKLAGLIPAVKSPQDIETFRSIINEMQSRAAQTSAFQAESAWLEEANRLRQERIDRAFREEEEGFARMREETGPPPRVVPEVSLSPNLEAELQEIEPELSRLEQEIDTELTRTATQISSAERQRNDQLRRELTQKITERGYVAPVKGLEEQYRLIPRQFKRLAGIPMDVIATDLGYPNVDTMVRDLQSIGKTRGSNVESAQRETEEIMRNNPEWQEKVALRDAYRQMRDAVRRSMKEAAPAASLPDTTNVQAMVSTSSADVGSRPVQSQTVPESSPATQIEPQQESTAAVRQASTPVRSSQTTSAADTTGLLTMGSGFASGMTESMYDMLWDKVQRGSVTEVGQPSAILQVAKMIRDGGGLKTRDEFKQLATQYMQIQNQTPSGPEFQSGLRNLVQKWLQQVTKPVPTSDATPQMGEISGLSSDQRKALQMILSQPGVKPDRILQASNGYVRVEWTDTNGKQQETLVRNDGTTKAVPAGGEKKGAWKVLSGLMGDEGGFLRLSQPERPLSPAMKKLSDQIEWLDEPKNQPANLKERIAGVGDWLNRARLTLSKQLFDDAAFLKAKQAIVGGKGGQELPVESDALLHLELMRKTIPGKTEFAATRLQDTLQPVGNKLREYLLYADAKTILQRNKSRGFTADEGTSVLTPAQAEDIIREVEKSPDGDLFQQTFEAEQKHFDDWITEAVRAGVLTQQDADNARLSFMDEAGDLNYVPLYRSQEDVAQKRGQLPPEGEQVAGPSRTPANAPSALQRQQGSNIRHMDPLERRLRYYARMSGVIERNKTMKAFANLNEVLPQEDSFMTKVSPPMEVAETGIQNIMTQLEDLGFDPSDLTDQTATVRFFRRSFRSGGGPGEDNLISFVNQGKREWYRVRDPEMLEVMTNTDPITSNVLLNALQQSAGAIRVGLTIKPGFVLANLIKDQATAWMASPRLEVPGQNLARGLRALWNQNDPIMQRVIRDGLKQGGFLSPEGMSRIMKEDITKPYEGTVDPRNIAKPAKWLWNKWMGVREGTEFATRAGEFMGEYKRRLSLGQDEKTAYLRALRSAGRITLNFTRGGKFTKTVNRYVPFFKIPFEAAYRINELAMEQPKRFVGQLVLPALSLGVLQAVMFADDERYKRASEYERDKYWLIPLPDSEAVLRIPKPDGVANALVNIAERTVREKIKEDPDSWRQFGTSLVREVFPNVSSAPLDMAMMIATRHVGGLTLSSDYPVIPRRELARSPQEQYGPETGRLYVEAGRLTGTSPRLVEASVERLIPGWADAYRTMEEATRRAKGQLPAAESPVLEYTGLSRFGSRPGTGKQGSAVGIFQEMNEDADRVQADIKARIERTVGHPVDMNRLNFSEREVHQQVLKELPAEESKLLGQRKKMAQVERKLDDLRKQRAAIEANSKLSAEEKRRKIDEVNVRLTEAAEQALQKLRK